MSQESPLFTKTFDLLAYLLATSEKFPRNQRVVLGRRIQDIALGFMDLLLTARKSDDVQRAGLLRRADIELDRLRYTIRLCQELNLFSQSQYQHASGLLVETGRLLGTWLKRYNAA